MVLYTDCSFTSPGEGGSQSELLCVLCDTETTNARFCFGFVLIVLPSEDLQGCSGLPGKKQLLQVPINFSGVFLPLSVWLDIVEIPQSSFSLCSCCLQRGSQGKPVEEGGEEVIGFWGVWEEVRGLETRKLFGSPSLCPTCQIFLSPPLLPLPDSVGFVSISVSYGNV